MSGELTELLALIKILKAEGVLKYIGKSVEVTMHPAALDLPEEAAEETADEPDEVAVVVPERLSRLNPNYFHPALGGLTDGLDGTD